MLAELVEKCGLGPRVVVTVELAHVLSGQFAFVSSYRRRADSALKIGSSVQARCQRLFECVLLGPSSTAMVAVAAPFAVSWVPYFGGHG